MQLDTIKKGLDTEIKAVENLIVETITSDYAVPNKNIPALASEIGKHIIQGGGKRMRPLLCILAAKACGYSEGQKHISLGAVLELIHVATLLHDDVIDFSEYRRGRPAANVIWDNSSSILVGDFFISRAFQLVAELEDVKIVKILAQTTNTMATGEVLQLMQKHNCDLSEEDYRHIIYCKTSSLFRACATLGATVSNSEHEIALATYGEHLGNAFQMIDDALDYSENSSNIGKNIGDDLAEGKTTLPLIYAINHADYKTKSIIKDAIKTGNREQINTIRDAIKTSGAFDYTIEQAKKQIDLCIDAIKVLHESEYKDKLEQIARFAINRAS